MADINSNKDITMDEKLEAHIRAYDFSNQGLLNRFKNQYKNSIKYVNELGMYIFWDGKKWTIQDDKKLGQKITEFVYALIKDLNKYIYYLRLQQLEREDEIKTFTAIVSKLKNLSAVKVIKDNFISVVDWLSKDDLDKNDDILNCQNGMLNIKTGKIFKHNPKMFCTKITTVGYNPSAKCPNFLSSLDWIFPDKNTRRELQKAFGYSLGGGMEHQVFFFLLGAGENGKSTISAPLKDLLGDYYGSLNSRSLEPKKDNTAASSDLAKLINTRYVMSSEPSSKQHLDDGMLKTCAVGEDLNARFMRQNEFTYNPTFKLWIPTNTLPVIINSEHGFWRRIIIFPCKNKPKKRVLNFYNMYIKPSELPGILNWSLEGRDMLEAEGFNPTTEMLDALQDYKEKSNSVEAFIAACCEKNELEKIQTVELHRYYNVWALTEGHFEMKIGTFRGRLIDMGYQVRKANQNKSYVFGLNLLKGLNLRDSYSYEKSMEKLDNKYNGKIVSFQEKFD